MYFFIHCFHRCFSFLLQFYRVSELSSHYVIVAILIWKFPLRLMYSFFFLWMHCLVINLEIMIKCWYQKHHPCILYYILHNSFVKFLSIFSVDPIHTLIKINISYPNVNGAVFHCWISGVNESKSKCVCRAPKCTTFWMYIKYVWCATIIWKQQYLCKST